MLAKESTSSHPLDLYMHGSRINGLAPGTKMSPPSPSPLKYDGLSKSWGSMHNLGSAMHRSVESNRQPSHSPSTEILNKHSAESQRNLSNHHLSLLDIYSKSSVPGSDRKQSAHEHQSKTTNRENFMAKRHSIGGIPSHNLVSEINPLLLTQQKYTDPYLPYLGTPLYPHSNLPNPYVINGHVTGDTLKSEVGNSLEDFQKRKKKDKFDIRDGVIPKKKKKIKVFKNGSEKIKNSKLRLISDHELHGELLHNETNKESKILSKDLRKSLQANSSALLQMQAKVHKLLNMKEDHADQETYKTSPKINGLISPSSVIKHSAINSEQSLKWNMDIISPNKTVNDIPNCCGVCKDRGVRYSPQCLNKNSPNLSNDDVLNFDHDKSSKAQSSPPLKAKAFSEFSHIDRLNAESEKNGLKISEVEPSGGFENKIEKLLASAVEERARKKDEGPHCAKLNTSDREVDLHLNSSFNLPHSGISCNIPNTTIYSSFTSPILSLGKTFTNSSESLNFNPSAISSNSNIYSDYSCTSTTTSCYKASKVSSVFDDIPKLDSYSASNNIPNVRVPEPVYSSCSDTSRTFVRSTSLDDLKSSVCIQNSFPDKSEKFSFIKEVKQEPLQEYVSQNAPTPSVSEAEKENINSDNCLKAAKINISSHSHSNSSSLPEIKGENKTGVNSNTDMKNPEAKLEHLAWMAERVQKLKSMISDEENLMDRLKKNIKVDIPKCSCKGPDYVVSEDVEGPYYTHLGAARSIQAIREMMEKRTGLTGKAVRIEKIRYSGKEGKSSRGCPIAKWIIRRSGPEEKYLCVVRQRQGHYCETACIVVITVAWEGVPVDMADDMYSYLVSQLTQNGFETERRCGTNERRTCACQGVDLAKRGASFSFGCSWSMYFNGCKFARSREVRKFKLKDTSQESDLETRFQNLATTVAPLYKTVAPDAYKNQTRFEEVAKDCRLGNESGRPFSGVTSCVDFCAHAHKDLHNMNNGSTVVVTLTKHRGFDKPEDEQLHVLPLYVMDMTDENGSREGQFDKIRTGSLEVLQQYPLEARIRSEPLTPCKKRGKGKKGGKDSPASKKSSPATPKNRLLASSTPQGKSKYNSSKLSRSSSDLYFNPSTAHQNTGNKMKYKHLTENSKKYKDRNSLNNGSIPDIGKSKKRVMSYDDMAVTDKNNQAFYESFWNYFNCFGAFPPPSFVNSWAVQRKSLSTQDETLPNNISGRYDSNTVNGHSKQEHSSNNSFGSGNVMTPSVISHHTSTLSLSSQSSDTHFNGAFHKEAKQSMSFDQQKQNEMGSSELPLDLSSSGSGSDLRTSLDFMSKENSNLKNDQTQKFDSSVKSGDPSLYPSNTSLSEVYDSPLHLLSEAVFLRTKGAPTENGQQKHPHRDTPADLPQNLTWGNNSTDFADSMKNNYFDNNTTSSCKPSVPHSIDNDKYMNNSMKVNGMYPQKMDTNFYNQTFNSHDVNQFHPNFGSASDAAESTLDPTVVKCELEYNEEAFRDPELGGVAVALNHGAVLFEVAKRELHATTGLRNPDRYAPTRISLVFYQHKNLNRSSHGWFEYEQKLEMLKRSRLEKLNEDKNSILPALDLPILPSLDMLRKKKKGKKIEKADLKSMPSVEYKYMWEGPLRRAVSLTTDSVITRWIDPQPMVTGPYQRWV